MLFRPKPDTRPEQLTAIERAMKAIRFAGCTHWEMARDLGIREGNLPYAFVAEFDDEAAYRAYDAHPEHDRIRRELIAPILERAERFQYHVS